jgi:hypothetical protein
MPSHTPQYGNFFKFGKDDVFLNRIKTYPKVEFFIYSGSIYLNNENQNAMNSNTPNGCVNLYELNVSRPAGQLIYPFITKKGSFSSFKTIATSDFNHDFVYGDVLSGSYPLTSSIVFNRYDETLGDAKKKVLYSLKNTLDTNIKYSEHYAYSSSLGDKEKQKINLISIPSIFYGSSIKKGTVTLKYYVSGALYAEASDIRKNGELIQTTGSTTDNVVGVVLYDHGFIMLTASGDLGGHKEKYRADPALGTVNASWHYFGVTDAVYEAPSSSFSLDFKGINYVNTLTMFAHAKENQLNFSNNPTFLATASLGAQSSSIMFREDKKSNIKNIVSSSYVNHSASYQPVTYISKVALYDKDRNLIGIAGLANPVRKLEDRGYTFKLKIDI